MRILPGVSLVLSIGLLALVADAQTATSGNGYVCSVVYRHPGSVVFLTNGNYGSVNFMVYSAPSCGGTFVGGYNLYSTGSNVATYGGDAGALYGEAPLMANFTALQQASASGQKISFQGILIKFGSQATSVTFGAP